VTDEPAGFLPPSEDSGVGCRVPVVRKDAVDLPVQDAAAPEDKAAGIAERPGVTRDRSGIA